MDALAAAPPRRWPARIALALAVVAAAANAVIAAVYGWLLPGLFIAASEGDDFSPDVIVSATPPLLLVGEIWYLTPLLWLVVMILGLRAHAAGIAAVAMVVASLSVVVFGATWLVMAGWML